MSLQICFVERKLVSPPILGTAFGQALLDRCWDVDGPGGYDASLVEIREVATEFRKKHPESFHDCSIYSFLQWCEKYWQQRGIDEEDEVSFILSY